MVHNATWQVEPGGSVSTAQFCDGIIWMNGNFSTLDNDGFTSRTFSGSFWCKFHVSMMFLRHTNCVWSWKGECQNGGLHILRSSAFSVAFKSYFLGLYCLELVIIKFYTFLGSFWSFPGPDRMPRSLGNWLQSQHVLCWF
jgi:hypothetical protein